MSERIYNVLFLCTGNSRSLDSGRVDLAERWSRQNFRAFSAGSQPKGHVNPFAVKVLREPRLSQLMIYAPRAGQEFASAEAPVMDFVFTVCDNAAGEICPVWPGQPMTAHWGIEDPAAVEGTDLEKEAAFVAALRYLKNRISIFTSLPLREHR